jgi:hypothetical protein
VDKELLLKRRQAVLDRLLVLESVPGSGCHDNDPLGPVKKGEPRHSDRPVLVHDEHESYFAGEDAARCAAVLAAYHEREYPLLTRETEPQLYRAVKAAGAVERFEGSDVLRVPRLLVNDVIYALRAEGVPVTGTGLKG